MFRVVPDQLKISDGWVRCGHCADVFDATLYLEAWVPPPPAPPPPPSLEPEPASDAPPVPDAVFVSPGAPESGPSPEDDGPDPVPAEGPEAEKPEAEAPVAAATADPGDGPESDFHADLRRFAQKSAPATAEDPAALPPAAPAPVSRVEAPQAPDEADEAEPVEPGFMRQARRKAFWQSPLMRGVLSLLLLLLAALLAGQWALHERDRLVAAQPALRPLLVRACAPLGCELAPLRRIDAVVIDSSTLTRRLGSYYGFDFVLKNNADLPLAVPALELSLTNSRDEVLSRRVFLPAELPGAPAELPAHGSVSLSLRLSIAVDGALPMAGYRALVFYP